MNLEQHIKPSMLSIFRMRRVLNGCLTKSLDTFDFPDKTSLLSALKAHNAFDFHDEMDLQPALKALNACDFPGAIWKIILEFWRNISLNLKAWLGVFIKTGNAVFTEQGCKENLQADIYTELTTLAAYDGAYTSLRKGETGHRTHHRKLLKWKYTSPSPYRKEVSWKTKYKLLCRTFPTPYEYSL